MKLACCIIENRALPNLVKLINDHLKYLPAGTDLFIYHGPANRYLQQMFPNAICSELNTPMDIQGYNKLLTSPSFYQNFLEYDKLLIFQHDSAILRSGIEEFIEMDVDYIGASWTWNGTYPGNGGLSLRTPKVMYEVCHGFPWNNLMNEDHWICMHMFDHRIGKLATIEQADKFSVEAKFLLGSWGCHAPCVWLEQNECQQIYSQYTLEKMSLTTDKNDPCLNEGQKEEGQNSCYLILSDEERAKGFVRPVRQTYVHVGTPGYEPCGKNLRILKPEDQFADKYYAVMCTAKKDCKILHSEDGKCSSGSYLTKEQYEKAVAGKLYEKKGCGVLTKMNLTISETYAHDPKFYGSTFCVGCNTHLPVDEFVWDGTNEKVGS